MKSFIKIFAIGSMKYYLHFILVFDSIHAILDCMLIVFISQFIDYLLSITNQN